MLTAAEMKRSLAVIVDDKHSKERRGLEPINRLGVHYYTGEPMNGANGRMSRRAGRGVASQGRAPGTLTFWRGRERLNRSRDARVVAPFGGEEGSRVRGFFGSRRWSYFRPRWQAR